MGNTQQNFDNKKRTISFLDSMRMNAVLMVKPKAIHFCYLSDSYVILKLTLSTSSSMMLEKTPPTLKINPRTRSNNPVTARQMIKAVLEQQEQQVPSDLFFDGIVD